MQTKRKSPLKLGFIGLGGVAQEHLRASIHSKQVEVVAGVDIDRGRVSNTASEYGFKPYADHKDMIANEALDGVCVLTPAGWHRPIVEDVCAAGLSVFCEKPLAVTLEDARAIQEAVSDAELIGQFGASYRFLPAMIMARDLISHGTIGEVRLCLELAIGGAGVDAVIPLSEAHYPIGGPGGTGMGLVDHGVHLIDAFTWLTGKRVEHVFGKANIAGNAPLPESIMLFLEGNTLGQLIYDEGTYSPALPAEGVFSEGAGWNVHGFIPEGQFDQYPCVFSIHGSKGALRIYPYANILIEAGPEGLINHRLSAIPQPNHFRDQIDAFAHAIRTGELIGASIDDGVSAALVLDGVYRSMESGRLEPVMR